MVMGRIKIGLQSKLFLGNLQGLRDWGFAGDYVQAIWLMLQQEKPDDYVVVTKESHTVQEFLEEAFGYVGLNWRDHVVIDKRYFQPSEVDNLKGDSTKARKILGWKPKIGFKKLVGMMVEQDLELAKREKFWSTDPTKTTKGYPPGIGVKNSLIVLGVINVLGFFFTFLVPESKGISLEDLSGETNEEKEHQMADRRTVPMV